MEIIKPRRDLLLIAGTGFVLLGLIIFLVFTPFLHAFFYGHWAFLFLAFILCFFPSPTQANEREYSPTAWFGLIFLMQLSLFALNFGISQAEFSNAFIQYGLFPWAWIAVLASAFATLAYSRHKNALGSTLLKTTAEKPIGIIINNILKFAQSAVLIFTFASMVLLMAGLLGFTPVLPFSEPIPLLGLFILIIFSFTKAYKRLFTRMLAFKPYWFIFMVILIVAAVMAALHAVSKNLQFTLPLPDFLNTLQAYPHNILSTIISLCWWFCLSILASLFVARISKGYSRRSIIAALFILPALLAIFFLIFPNIPIQNIPEMPRNILAIFGFISCLILFMNRKMLSPLVLNYLPKNGENKYRNPEFLLRKLIQMSLIFLYFYLPLGPVMSAAFLFIAAFPLLIFALLFGLVIFSVTKIA